MRPLAPGDLEARISELQALGRDREAIPFAEILLTSREGESDRDPLALAAALSLVGSLAESSNQPVRAEEVYLRALRIREDVQGKTHLDSVRVLVALARLYQNHGEGERALAIYGGTLETLEKSPGNERQIAEVLRGLGELHQDRRDFERARDVFEKALEMHERAQDTGAAMAKFLDAMAGLFVDIGDYARAETLYGQALAAARGDRGVTASLSATILANRALVSQRLGENGRAEQLYRQALEILEQAYGPEHPDVASVLNNLASLYALRGEYGRAEQAYRRALAIRSKAIGSESLEVATVLNNLASLYLSVGDASKAEQFYEKSREIRERILGAEAPEVAAALNNLAAAKEAQGDLESAEHLYRRAYEIYKDSAGVDPSDSEAVLGNIANLLLRQGKSRDALPLLERGDWPTGLGAYYLAINDYRAAHREFLRGVGGLGPKADTDHLMASYIGLGQALEGLGQLGLAAESYRAAVVISEEGRASVAQVDRTRFLASSVGAGFQRIQAYEGLIRVSGHMGDPEEALRWAEHTKARRLLEAAGRGSQSPKIPRDLAEREEQLESRRAALFRQRDEVLSKNPQLVGEVESEISRVGQDRITFVEELRRREPAYAAYKYPRPVAVSEVPLRPGEVFLEYAVTERETLVWLLRGGKIAKFLILPIGRDSLAKQVAAYRSLFQGVRRTSDLRSDLDLGSGLYDLLLREILSACQAGETLIIAPDASLGLIPFEAMVVDKGLPETATPPRYLGDIHAIQYVQSATVLANLRILGRSQEQPREQRLLALGDPTFEAPAGASGGQATNDSVVWRRLEKTGNLLRLLQEGFGAKRMVSLSGTDASETSLRKQDLQAFTYLLFATHGVLAGQIPYVTEPALVLSQIDVDRMDPKKDGFLTLGEASNLELEADLAMLTACDTGVGEKVEGEGVMGMGWAFQYAGARNVVISLWSVDQEASVQLTASFFERLRDGIRPQDALRGSREALRHRGYVHPFFWAPFVLVGDQ